MADESPMDLISNGITHHTSGNVDEAEKHYRGALELDPANADALHLLGVIHAQKQDPRTAISLIKRAIARAPLTVEFWCNLGNTLRADGQPEEALAAYREALRLNPDAPDVSSLLSQALTESSAPLPDPNSPDHPFTRGGALGRQKKFAPAIDHYRRAVRRTPDHADSFAQMASCLVAEGRLDEAIEAFQQAVAIRPDLISAHNNLGNALKDKGRLDEAAEAYRQTVRLNPTYASGYYNLGIVLAEQDKLEEAREAYLKAIDLKPDLDIAYNNLGNCLKRMSRIDEAIAAYQKAVALNPKCGSAWNNLGVCLLEKGLKAESKEAHLQAIAVTPTDDFRFNLGISYEANEEYDLAIKEYQTYLAAHPDHSNAWYNLGHAFSASGEHRQALAAYRKAISIKPDLANARYNAGITLLLLGQFADGWQEYEHRWEASDFPAKKRQTNKPQWDGADIRGKRIILHAEQGLGDAMQFVRYAPLVADLGAEVILECSPELGRLFNSVRGVKSVRSSYPSPPHEVHCPFLSLPDIFKTSLDTIPASVPYFGIDDEIAAPWKKRITKNGRVKIGINWAGQPNHRNDRNRSFTLGQLAPLAHAIDADFYSLQKGSAAAQADSPPADMRLVNFSADIIDLADSAAIVEQMDLIITVDTAIAHLAGGLARPVWVIVPANPDWRWMLDREDSPWYPTMRLFRQQSNGDKAGVVARICDALKAKWPDAVRR